jgi:hypothetical protein
VLNEGVAMRPVKNYQFFPRPARGPGRKMKSGKIIRRRIGPNRHPGTRGVGVGGRR